MSLNSGTEDRFWRFRMKKGRIQFDSNLPKTASLIEDQEGRISTPDNSGFEARYSDLVQRYDSTPVQFPPPKDPTLVRRYNEGMDAWESDFGLLDAVAAWQEVFERCRAFLL